MELEDARDLARFGRCKISKVGNSHKLTIPADLLKLWGFENKKDFQQLYIYADMNKSPPEMIVSLNPLSKVDVLLQKTEIETSSTD